MAIISSSLKEFENFSRHLGQRMLELSQCLTEYKNTINKDIVEQTAGGSQAIGVSGNEGIILAIQDVEKKASDLITFLKKAAEIRSEVSQSGIKSSDDVNYV